MDMTFQLFNEECLQAMKHIPDGSVDMVMCDLPYGTTQNKWDSVIDLPSLWAAYRRVCKKNAAIVLTASQPFTSVLTVSNLPMFRHEWLWIKNRGSNFANTVREPFKEHESALVFSQGKWTYNKLMQERTGGGLSRVSYPIKGNTTESGNYGKFEVGKELDCGELRVPSSWQKFNCEVGFHPTQKPVVLMEYLIKTYTNEGQTVLDNTMGSGTTGVACGNLGRRFIGIEQDVEHGYFQIAEKRIRAAFGKYQPGEWI
jgi:site-specific DNA-methyltransferase (adenine-specific)